MSGQMMTGSYRCRRVTRKSIQQANARGENLDILPNGRNNLSAIL